MAPRTRRDLDVWQQGDAILGGGTWLFSEPQPHLRRLLDLSAFGWPALAIGADGLHIAATCTIAALHDAALPETWIAAPLVRQCCRALLGSFKIWNMATVGGNICLALPAGPMTSLTAALDGVATIWMPDGGDRPMRVADMVTGPNRTALRPGEILRGIHLPADALMRRTAFRQISLTPNGRSGALLIGTVSPQGDDFALTVTAATPRPVRIGFDRIPDEAGLAAAIEAAIPPAAYYDDMHGRPDWRRHVTRLLAEDIRTELATP
jgi:CO/xanthine dehydrogenase FAD-binding subunit